MKPKISVIIPAHNEEKYIRATLHSLKGQKYQNFETIVVANGCTDNTEALVKKNSKVKLFSMSQANVSRARNYGADKAVGEYLLFLDADTILDENALYTIANNFKSNVATFKLKYDHGLSIISGLKNFQNSTKLFKGFAGSFVCTKSEFEKVGGYDPEKIVKEHHSLKKKIGGSYSVLPATVTTSARRFRSKGILSIALFWMTNGKEYEKIR